jgi:hypothetical protein
MGMDFDPGADVKALEKLDLVPERPGAEDLSKGIGRGIGDEAGLFQPGGENVAAPAPADEDLPATILRSFEEQHSRAGRGGVNRGHQSSSPGADDRYDCQVVPGFVFRVGRDIHRLRRLKH